MLTDLYQLTMINGYLKYGLDKRKAAFDVFYRGSGGFGYAIAAGLEQVVEYIKDLHFSEDDVAYLRSQKIFGEEFLDALRDFKFTGNIKAVPEGARRQPKQNINILSLMLLKKKLSVA